VNDIAILLFSYHVFTIFPACENVNRSSL